MWRLSADRRDDIGGIKLFGVFGNFLTWSIPDSASLVLSSGLFTVGIEGREAVYCRYVTLPMFVMSYEKKFQLAFVCRYIVKVRLTVLFFVNVVMWDSF